MLFTGLLRPCMCRNVAKYSTNCTRMNWEVIINPKLKWIWSVILPDCMLNTWFYLFTENKVMPALAGIAANQPSAPAELEREVSPRPVSPRRSIGRAENLDEMQAINEVKEKLEETTCHNKPFYELVEISRLTSAIKRHSRGVTGSDAVIVADWPEAGQWHGIRA